MYKERELRCARIGKWCIEQSCGVIGGAMTRLIGGMTRGDGRKIEKGDRGRSYKVIRAGLRRSERRNE